MVAIKKIVQCKAVQAMEILLHDSIHFSILYTWDTVSPTCSETLI